MSAAADQQPPVKGPGGGTPPRQDETDLWMLVHDCGVKPRNGARIMGMHPKRLLYLCEKWSRQGKYDYGVSADLGWSKRRYAPRTWITPEPSFVRGEVRPPPPPFGGASLAMQVVMAGRDTNPALREANRRAVASVRRRARADAQRIVVRDVRPAPPSMPGAVGVMFTELLMRGQVFVQHGHITRPRQHQPVTMLEGWMTPPPVSDGSRYFVTPPLARERHR